MKIGSSVKTRKKCKGCQIVVRKRQGKPVRYNICKVDPRHKMRQG